MFLAPDGEEIEVTDAAAEFLREAMPIDRLHTPGNADMQSAMREQLGAMGWFALALPEDKGGSGLTAVEHALFFREVGRLCGPVDVLVQSLAAHVAGEDLRGTITSGAIGVALVVADKGRLRLIGSPDATLALQANEDGARLFDIASIVREQRDSLDVANSFSVLDVAEAAPVAQAEGSAIWQLGMLGVAAMQIGLAEAALDQIVEYAKVRETFGRKIGAYQAVRHPCADMALRAEAARCQLWYAAAAIKEGRTDADTHLNAAKHLANQAAVANADSNIQLHGGIGVTDEHHAHLFLKHTWLLGKLFGSKRALLARLLDARVES